MCCGSSLGAVRSTTLIAGSLGSGGNRLKRLAFLVIFSHVAIRLLRADANARITEAWSSQVTTSEVNMAQSLQPVPATEEFPDELPKQYEIVCGNLVRKAVTSFPHQVTQLRLGAFVAPFHGRRGDPGGWWLGTEGNVLLFLKPNKEQYRPDLVGWRISKMPAPLMQGPIDVWPQWVCEILSPSTAARDKGEKLDAYHRAHVEHYWLVDPEKQTLTVLAWTEDGYQTILTAGRGDRVRAEPFVERELDLDWLFDFE